MTETSESDSNYLNLKNTHDSHNGTLRIFFKGIEPRN